MRPGHAQAPHTDGLAVHDRAYAVDQWTVEDGLPVNSIYDLHEGPQGYLWLGTHDGLVRFDGERFEVFDMNTTPVFSSNRFIHLYEARDETMWMLQHRGHLVRYADGHFTQDPAAFGLPPDRLNPQLRVLAEGVWVATREGVWRYDPDAGGFEAVAPAHLTMPVRRLLRGDDGTLWAGTEDGEVVAVRRTEAGGWTEVVRLTAADGLAPAPVDHLYEAEPGVLRISSGDSFARYVFASGDPASGTLTHATDTDAALLPFSDDLPAGGRADGSSVVPGGGLPHLPPSVASSQHEGATRWVLSDTTHGGRWWHRGGAVYHDTTHVLTIGSRLDAAVVAGGSLWVGTHTKGLLRVAPATFRTLSTDDGLAAPAVHGLARAPGGALWAATQAGLSRVDATGRPRVLAREAFDGPPGEVRSVLHDRDGHVWVGTLSGLCRVEGRTCRPVPLPTPMRREVEAIYQDRHGALWVGTHEGLLRGRSTARGDVRWTARLGLRDGLPALNVQRILEAPNGALWIATDGGGIACLAAADLDAPAARLRFENLTPAADGLFTGHVRELFFDPPTDVPAGGGPRAELPPPRRLWLGTDGRGLVRLTLAYDDSLHVTEQVAVTEADGLAGSSIHRILPDDQGRWWMSTNEGIFWVRRDDLMRFADRRGWDAHPHVHATVYTERDGLRLREANGGVQLAGLRGADGRLWFPTQDGLAVVDPAAVPAAMPLPQPVITGARLGPKPLPFDPDGRLRLAPDQRTFALDYTAPSLRDARGLHFRYRLRGFERGWNEGDAMRMAFYTKVPPGRYTFEVAVERGQGDVRLATLPVRVVPTLWETTWMRVLLALGTLGALGALVQRYLHARKRREAELAHLVEARTAELAEAKDRAERLGEAKTAFLASMSHEIRTPLTAIVGFSEVLLEEVGDAQRGHAELVNRSSRRLRATLTSILDLARLEAGKEDVTLHTVDLAREAREVVEEMRPRAEAKGLALTLDLPTPPACPVRANRSHLGSVLLNLLSNAIKYTDAGGRVTVAVTDPPDPDAMPHVMVRDTGMGMDADTQAVVFEPFVRQDRRTVDDRDGAGLGLAITQKLVDLMGGRITLDSAPGEGSTFTVYLPRGD